MRFTKLLLGVGLLTMLACQPDPPEPVEPTAVAIPTTLPMQEIALDDLSNFKTDGKNWQIAGDVYSDPQTQHDFKLSEGKGILANNQTDAEKAHLYTAFEHGDMELDVEFMVPKGSNSGIYFQGRYEVQIFDSYGDEAKVTGAGAIYERWDDSKPEGEQGYEGHAPRVNASKMPGLWQHFKIFFRAPRFDESGKKIKNAMFEHVYHNGMLVHKDVELTGPTRAAVFENDPEVPYAPMVIQGDHGPVAFRHFKYKAYTQDSLSLNNIAYTIYDYPSGDSIPNFDSLKVLKEGTTDLIDVEELSEQQDHFAAVFKGDLDVPVTGTYLFRTGIDDGGDLYIDGERVVNNEGSNGYNDAYGMVELTEGKHSFELNYHEEVWAARVLIWYEGPGIYQHMLATKVKRYPWQKERPTILVEAEKEPELLRGFVNYGDEKRTHCISVGNPEGMHFSYDLNEGSLLKFWRGDFGDVTNMWHNRGISQLCLPLNAPVEAVADAPIAQLDSEQAGWPEEPAESFRFKGYELNEKGQPVFNYNYMGARLVDHIAPGNNNMLTRTMNVAPNGSEKLYVRIARAPNIQKRPNGMYSIDGQYFLQMQSGGGSGDVPASPIIREQDGQMEMLLAVTGDTEIKYGMMW
ncbi:MAG: family 16 glycoside hydrolase [Bacteroidota bacterium]